MGTGEQRPNCEGTRGTKTLFGNRKHKKTNFRFQGGKGTGTLWEGLTYMPSGAVKVDLDTKINEHIESLNRESYINAKPGIFIQWFY